MHDPFKVITVHCSYNQSFPFHWNIIAKNNLIFTIFIPIYRFEKTPKNSFFKLSRHNFRRLTKIKDQSKQIVSSHKMNELNTFGSKKINFIDFYFVWKWGLFPGKISSNGQLWYKVVSHHEGWTLNTEGTDMLASLEDNWDFANTTLWFLSSFNVYFDIMM